MTDRSRDPFTGGPHAPLVAGRTEVASFAGEVEETLMAAIGACEARESGGKVATAKEGFDGGDDRRMERTEGRTVLIFVIRGKGTSAVIDKLPKRRGTGAALLIDGWHEIRSHEHILCGARYRVIDRYCRRSRPV